MKTYSIMKTQHNLAGVLREVAAGYEVGITRRNKLVAKILPVEEDQRVDFPDFEERARGIWKGKWKGSSTDDLIDITRGSR